MAVANRIKFSDVAFWCFALSVSLLPIGLGGNRPLPFGLAQAGLAISCLFLILDADACRKAQLFPRLRWAFGLFAAVIAWALLQILPILPAGWGHPIWQEAARVLGRPLHGVIAIAPEDALEGLSRLVTYIGAGALAYFLTQDAGRARRLIKTLWLTGAIICLYGLVGYVSGAHKILWLDKWAYQGDLTATFVNRNHFAIYAGMVLTAGIALLLQSLHEDVLRFPPQQRSGNLWNWLATKGLPHGALAALVLLSIVFSHSRAGLILTVAGLGSYLFFDRVYRKAWRGAIVTVISALAVLALTYVVAQQVSPRFAHLFNDYSSYDRFKVYGWVLNALNDNPWLGHGLNSFQPIFRLYQQNMIMEFTRAHSDVLESLLDLGLPAGFALWGAIGLLISGLVHGVLERRQHGLFPVLGLAVSVIVLGHALVDFDMQIPGVVLYWAALLGTGLAHSWRQSEKLSVQEREAAPAAARPRTARHSA